MNSRGYFDYLHFRFDLTKGWDIAERDAPANLIPDQDWMPVPLLMGEHTDSKDVPLVATFALDYRKVQLVIDGLTAAQMAIQECRAVDVFILSMADTMKVLTTPMMVRRTIINQGIDIGLL